MSSLDSSREKLAGLTLNDVLANQKRLSNTQPSEPKSRTLLDIIKEDESNKKDRRSWKAFKDKLRVKRAGSAWTSSIHIPTSDPLIQFHHMSTNYNAHQVDDLNSSPAPATKPQFSRRSSTRYGSPGDSSGDDSSAVGGGGGGGGGGALRPMLSRRNSTTVPSQSEPYRRGRVVTFRDSLDDDDSDDEMNNGSGRVMSAREAVAAQEASEAAAAEAELAEEEEQPMTMSLMDLLEETDREMGVEGSRYILSDDDFDDDDDDDDDEDDDDDDDEGEDVMEYTCCVCMVKHKGSAFITCGHTFCRMCSRELNVSRGNCPLCNNFILEILHIF